MEKVKTLQIVQDKRENSSTRTPLSVIKFLELVKNDEKVEEKLLRLIW